MQAIEAEPIGTERFVIEPLTVEHAPAMAAVLADPALYAYTGGTAPQVAELRERYARWVAGSGEPGTAWCNWVLRDRASGELVGWLQATVSGRAAAELAWVVGSARQGQGVAKEAARALAGWLRGQGVALLVAHVHPGHAASAAVAAAAGLRPTGRLVDGEVRWEG
ncbi:GNAT family N-acetyltransferase [Streptomyces tateyamensis]|uniref:GNAT family N-acetyltransferase n=1 Tax=Streptomyces tateyamensis TaxID=565073 RepID=UPI001FE3BE6D|nr:GNAT family N-acetyltransferase [Streptomyces tateyamensis]